MMFILAPDAFKESMTAKQACDAMKKGILQVFPDAKCISIPLADGGEGTMQALVDASNGTVYNKMVTGPLGEKVWGKYAVLGDGKTAVVELASASGLHLVPPEKRNPLLTTTFGTGELIRAALTHPIQKLIIGIGGSATNDGGAGILQALGFKLQDKDGREIGYGGGELMKLEKIDCQESVIDPAGIMIEVACDVNNPLTGKSGASVVYGPQKGATLEMVLQLDANLENYAQKIKACNGKEVRNLPGSGAAGGTGAGLMAFFNAKLIKGIDLVISYTQLIEKIKDADYVFTGEGCIDRQTLNGKTISGLVSFCKKYQKKVFAFAGKVEDEEMLREMGITAVFKIDSGTADLTAALKSGPENLEKTVAMVVRKLL